MSDQLGILVVGCGYWGMNYVRTFADHPQARLVAVCDVREERLREVQRRYPGTWVTTDLMRALEQPDVDAAVICTEASAHYDTARHCIEHQKHVLIEKPMATTSARARKLLDMVEACDVQLMVGHIFLYNPGIRKVKDCIVNHDLGQLYYLYARRTNLGPVRTDVNALWDLATHDVSIFNYLQDALPEWVSAIGSPVLRRHSEDVGFLVLGYPNNVLGHIHVSWAEPHKVREVVVVGSDKRIAFNDLDALELVRIYEKGIAANNGDAEADSFGEYQLSIRDGDIISPRVEVSEPLKNQCNHFLDCVKNGTAPLSDGVQGLEVVRILEAAGRSMAQRGAPVELRWDDEAGVRPVRRLSQRIGELNERADPTRTFH